MALGSLRCPRGSVGMAALLCRWQTAGGGSIPRWSASKPQVVTRRNAKGADKKKVGSRQPWWQLQVNINFHACCHGSSGRKHTRWLSTLGVFDALMQHARTIMSTNLGGSNGMQVPGCLTRQPRPIIHTYLPKELLNALCNFWFQKVFQWISRYVCMIGQQQCKASSPKSTNPWSLNTTM